MAPGASLSIRTSELVGTMESGNSLQNEQAGAVPAAVYLSKNIFGNKK